MAHELIHFVVFSLGQFESMSQIGDFAFEFFEPLNQNTRRLSTFTWRMS